jgi:hypothetical protein
MSPQEIADQMIDATKSFVRRALDPVTQRISTLEARVGALSMLGGKPGEKAISQLESLEARLAVLEEALKEREAS